MRKYLLIFTALASLTGQIAQESMAQDNQELSMTIYGDGRALIEDVRDFSFPEGRSVIVLPNVSSQINAPSASFIADDIEIVEQNFDFDLLTPNKLMQKAVGETVTIIRTNPGTGVETREKAKVLAVNNGVVVQIGRRIEVLRDDNLPTRVIFDKIPENLRAKPTLSVMVNSAKASTRPATLTYLSGGLSWRADYVLMFNEQAKKMDLQGWATLTNNTNTTFKNVKTSLIAGHVGNKNRNQYNRNNRRNVRGNVRSGGTEQSPQERVGDNYLYPLPGTTTIASSQTKQVSFVDAESVAADKSYEYEARWFQTLKDPQNVDVRIVFSNSRDAGLGEALPKGIIRVYAKDAQGRSQFIGEDTITHVAGGSELALKIGEAFDVTVKPSVMSTNKVSSKRTDTSMKYEIKNAKNEPVKVTIRQQLWGWRTEYDIRKESHDSRTPDAYSRVWTVDVPAEGSTNLTFTIRETRPY
ncbi:MAG: DUF4139 domain-containing protein [Robiginitomaculum sp.]|nr:DUF4139 domain-containing protein [Robiginitomaculum sp.]